jgi:hypothetical protein
VAPQNKKKHLENKVSLITTTRKPTTTVATIRQTWLPLRWETPEWKKPKTKSLETVQVKILSLILFERTMLFV